MNDSQKMIGDLVFPKEERHFLVFDKKVHEYQKAQRDYAMQFVKNWKLCIDVGGHVGIFSRHFAQHFDEVLAFEPIENLSDCFVQNVPSNVTVISCALGDRVGRQKIRKLSTTNSGCSFFVGDKRVFEPRNDEGEVIEVPIVTLDDYMPPSFGLIKIDVQGADNLVLRGAEQSLRRFKPVVLMEEKPAGGPTGPRDHIKDAHEFLRSLGYLPKNKVGADRTFVHEQA